MFNRAQVVVEHACRWLKGRWRCKKHECDVELAKSMVQTGGALHNLCEYRGEAFGAAWDVPGGQNELVETVAVNPGEGRNVRDAIVQLWINN